jgi:ABC-type glucose/galactose transport system permease subunit
VIVDGFFIAGAILCAVAVLLGVVATIIRTYPDDFALVSVALLEVFLVVYGISAAIRQAGGQPISGEPWEFWGYLLTALLIPALAFIWAVTDKSRYSNTVLAVSGAIVFVMLYRMEQIWDGALPA